MKMSFKRGKKTKSSDKNPRVVRKYHKGRTSPSPPTTPRIELPVESRSPSPVRRRRAKRRAGSESPNSDDYKRPSEWFDGLEDVFDPVDGVVDGEDVEFFREGKNRRRVVPSNFLRKVWKSMKHLEQSVSNFDVSPTDVTYTRHYYKFPLAPFNACGEGVQDGERIGSSINVKRLAVRLQFATSVPVAFDAIGGVPWRHAKHFTVRVVIYVDRRPPNDSGSIMKPDLFLNDSSSTFKTLLFRNPYTLSAYHFLYDKVHTFTFPAPVTYGEEVATVGTSFLMWPTCIFDPIDIFVDVDFDTTYRDGTASASSVVSNRIEMVVLPDFFDADNVPPVPPTQYSGLNARSRLTFVEK